MHFLVLGELEVAVKVWESMK